MSFHFLNFPFSFLDFTLFSFIMIRNFPFYFSSFYFFLLLPVKKISRSTWIRASTDLVVDASIENGKYPVVSLSKSLAYFSKLDPNVLTESFVHNARVLISNGSVTCQLQEYNSKDDSTGILLYYYTFTDSYSGPKFKGSIQHPL